MNKQPNKITEELKTALSIPKFKELNCMRCKNGIIYDYELDASSAISYTLNYINQDETRLNEVTGISYSAFGEQLANKEGKTFYKTVSSPCPYKYCRVPSGDYDYEIKETELL